MQEFEQNLHFKLLGIKIEQDMQVERYDSAFANMVSGADIKVVGTVVNFHDHWGKIVNATAFHQNNIDYCCLRIWAIRRRLNSKSARQLTGQTKAGFLRLIDDLDELSGRSRFILGVCKSAPRSRVLNDAYLESLQESTSRVLAAVRLLCIDSKGAVIPVSPQVTGIRFSTREDFNFRGIQSFNMNLAFRFKRLGVKMEKHLKIRRYVNAYANKVSKSNIKVASGVVSFYDYCGERVDATAFHQDNRYYCYSLIPIIAEKLKCESANQLTDQTKAGFLQLIDDLDELYKRSKFILGIKYYPGPVLDDVYLKSMRNSTNRVLGAVRSLFKNRRGELMSFSKGRVRANFTRRTKRNF